MARRRNIDSLTVLMPAYNAMPYLPLAVESILTQTFGDFEFLIIDDGSTDGSARYLDRLTDVRIRVVHQENKGLEATLNRGLKEARYDWVARMDADDISLPERLEKEIAFLQDHPEYALVSCANGYIGRANRRLSLVQKACLANPPRYDPWTDSAILHGGVVYNRNAVLRVGGYRKAAPAEDLDLWFLLGEKYKMASIEDVLVLVRILPEGISSSGFILQRLNWRWARLCAESRKRKEPEPDLKSFQIMHWPHGISRFQMEGARHFRMGGAAFANAQVLRTIFHLFLAVLLSPTLFTRKILGYLRASL